MTDVDSRERIGGEPGPKQTPWPGSLDCRWGLGEPTTPKSRPTNPA
jgi:hypothetical protein